jgi:DNA mismatch endonuclease, patch repair protein
MRRGYGTSARRARRQVASTVANGARSQRQDTVRGGEHPLWDCQVRIWDNHPVDVMTPAQRSAAMARIRSKDTKPELVVRRLLHSLGYRYRLHRSDLPGKPDLVFPRRRSVVFVNGCFWHGHGCKLSSSPKTRSDYWADKISGNRARDRRNIRRLRNDGWHVCVVWECDTRASDLGGLARRLTRFLEGK